jgi:hypothetical protein
MRDWGGATGMRSALLLAETLGLAMAQRAADILERHRHQPTPATPAEDLQFAADDAIFSAVLDAATDCLARLDTGSAEDRWCDALVHLLLLARLTPDAMSGCAPRDSARERMNVDHFPGSSLESDPRSSKSC